MPFLEVFIFLVIFIFGVYFYFTRNFNHWKNLGIKQDPPSFFFGNTGDCIFAKKRLDTYLKELYDNASGEKLIGFYVFNRPYLMLRDPSLIKDVFVKDFSNFSNKLLCGNDTDLMGSTNLFLAKNPPWKHIRTKLTPVFTSGKLKKMLDLMTEIGPDFVQYMNTLNIDDKVGKTVEVSDIAGKLMTDIIGTVAFGMKFNSLTNPNAEFRKVGEKIFKGGLRRYYELLAIFFMPMLRPFLDAKFLGDEGTDFLRKSFWEVINHREESKIKRADLIDILVDIKKNQDDSTTDVYKLEGDALVAQAAVFFSGGFETTSTAITFALYELAKNKEMQDRLRTEILDQIKKDNGSITYEMIMGLPYLNMVVHEALRMYPVLPWLDRIAEEDYRFSGTNIVIKKGTPVVLPMRALHMDPKYFPDPEKFVPERFTEENKKNIEPCTFFPFGDGPRNCVGSRLGLIQTKLGLIYFLSNYELSLSSETMAPPKLDKFNVLTHPENGMHLHLRKLKA